MASSCQEQSSNISQQTQQTNEATIPNIVDFNFHVKPILSDNCFKCHGPDASKREGGLGLHTEEMAFAALGKDSRRYAIVPGNVAASHLVRRIWSQDPDDMMPPPEANLPITDYQRKILEKWIEQGAEWKQHWAFIAPKEEPIPDNMNGWAINDIDRFVQAKHIEMGMEPSGKTNKDKLLRRVSYTLTGLPPTIDQLDEFLNDESEKAYEKAVDRLLDSDGYAERMTQIWMDLSRYADSHGYQDDPERFMWPWRDWVIHAYKQNMPYDQFVKWQLAGDMIPDASMEQIIASGFNRNHKITYEGGSIPEEFRTEYVADRGQTFGTAFLGLTVECSRCHDHKYDPISQSNYFEFYAFFNNVPELGLTEPVGKTPIPFVTLTSDQIANQLTFINNYDSLSKIELMVMKEMPKPRETFILARGQYDQPTTKVTAKTPDFILPFGERPPNRLGLADWLFDPQHPLTARVAVNRLWQQAFGTGLVASAQDFGNQGTLPSHPELLDYLAVAYQNSGWDTKKILKDMVMSATFRQSAIIQPDHLEIDPENRWLARAPRLRLDGEMIRDQALFAAGLMEQKVGGPSVRPYQPDGLWAETIGGGGDLRTYIPDTGDKLYRRSLYTFWKRTVPPPSMLTFDVPSKDLCTIKRQETNTPLQALILLNDPQVVEASRMLATDALINKEQVEDRISYMFRKVTSRLPSPEEVQVLVDYYKQELERFSENLDGANAYLAIGESPPDAQFQSQDIASYALVANAIFNLDEAISRD